MRETSADSTTPTEPVSEFDSERPSFDVVRKEVPDGAYPGPGVTAAPNPDAHEVVKQRVPAFFAETLR